MPKPIRILHVIGIMNRGGAETMIMNLYRNVDREKVQFDFVQNENTGASYDGEITALGGKIYHCPRYCGKNHFLYIKWWKDFFEQHHSEYPVVHGHIGSTAAIYLSVAKKYGAYTIAHSHSAGTGTGLYRFFAYPTRYVADHFFACSRDAGVSRYGKKVGMDVSRCQVLSNAIDTRKFVFSEEIRCKVRKKLHIEEGTLVVGHVGRFVDAKNHVFLLEIFRQLHQRNKDSVLLLIGDGELRPQIEAVVKQKSLENAVILTGVQPNVCDYYQAMDVFAFPSVYEGLPVSLVEAQAAGVPCCVSGNVPQEAAITDLVEFVRLEDGASRWADRVLLRAREPRRNMYAEIEKAGFDVSVTSKWLEEFYTKVVTRCGG